MTLSIILMIFLFSFGEAANLTSLDVPSGHWRLSLEGDSFLRCPYGEIGCEGGTQSGDFLCSDSFSGLLCAKPAHDHFIDWAAQDSLLCDDSVVLSSILIPVLVVLSILLFVCRNVGMGNGARQLRDLSLLRCSLSCNAKPLPLSQVPSVPTQDSVDSGDVLSSQVVNPHRPNSCTSPWSLPAHQATRPVRQDYITNHNESSMRMVQESRALPATHTITAGPVENNGSGGSGEDGADYKAEANMDLLHKLKILIFALQVYFKCSVTVGVLYFVLSITFSYDNVSNIASFVNRSPPVYPAPCTRTWATSCLLYCATAPI